MYALLVGRKKCNKHQRFVTDIMIYVPYNVSNVNYNGFIVFWIGAYKKSKNLKFSIIRQIAEDNQVSV